MRVVVDTNTLISGLISRGGPPAGILALWRTGVLTVLISREMVEEYRDVLVRDRFRALGTVPERLDLLAALLGLDNVHPVVPSERLTVVERDPDDNRVLECAVTGQADAIITGDDDLLALKTFRGIPTLSPARFLERVGP